MTKTTNFYYKHGMQINNFEFSFADQSAREINSNNVGRVKAGLTRRINSATYTLVIVGKEANKLHRDYKLIGYRNWINFEIAKSKDNGNKLVAVKINRAYKSPEELLNSGASWALSFTEEAIGLIPEITVLYSATSFRLLIRQMECM